MHAHVMSPRRRPDESPWIWSPFEFDLIFGAALNHLRAKQGEAPNADRADCIEWLSFTMDSSLYAFDLGEYSDETVREIKEAVGRSRDAILGDKRLVEHPNRNLRRLGHR